MWQDDRDQFTSELVELTNDYLKEVATIRFDLTLRLYEGYTSMNEVDTEGLLAEAERKMVAAKKKLDEETLFLIKKHNFFL